MAEVRIVDGQDRLELVRDRRGEPVRATADVLLSVAVRVSAPDGRFTARSTCWIEGWTLSRFVRDLQALERNRRGSASLESMSPGELRLAIGIADRAGHVVATGQVGRWSPSTSGAGRWSSVSFELEVDPTFLPGLVRQFTLLTDAPATSSRHGPEGR